MPNSKERKKRRSKFFIVETVLRDPFAFVSFLGLFMSIGLHLIFLSSGAHFKEVETITYLPGAVMFPLSIRIAYHDPLRRLPWYGKTIPLGIALYGLWSWLTGPLGALNELPTDVRMVAIQHETIFLHSIMIGGYAYLCIFWWYTNRRQLSRNHA